MDKADKTFAFRVFLITIFIPVATSHALYEGLLGLKRGFLQEWDALIMLWNNPPRMK